MVNNILIEVLGSIAEEERVKIRQTQKEGINIAKREGKYKSRKPSELHKDFSSLYNMWKEGYITAVEFAKSLCYKSRNTTYKKIRQYEEENMPKQKILNNWPKKGLIIFLNKWSLRFY